MHSMSIKTLYESKGSFLRDISKGIITKLLLTSNSNQDQIEIISVPEGSRIPIDGNGWNGTFYKLNGLIQIL